MLATVCSAGLFRESSKLQGSTDVWLGAALCAEHGPQRG